jgi:hypothetical protein
MKTRTLLAAAGLCALAACTNNTPVENASRNLSEAADNVADDFSNAAANASAAITNQTGEMRNALGNAAETARDRADRIRDAARNSVRDIGNAAEGR